MITPTATWSGRMILPKTEQRRDDGRVFLQVLHTPNDQPAPPVGSIVELVWSEADRLEVQNSLQWSQASERSRQRGDILPERLLGWKNITPLESLVGARRQDDLVVALEGVHWDGQRMVTTQQPTEICGPEKMLATLEDVQASQLLARDPMGQSVIVDYHARPERLAMNRLQGQQVWLYGQSQENGHFLAQGLLPAALLDPRPDQTYQGLDECRRALRTRVWAGVEDRMNEIRTVHLNPSASQKDFPSSGPYLALHTYGGYQGPGGDPTLPLGIVGGHFAYGSADQHEGHLETHYHQVYGQNPDQVLSATQSQDAYLGNFERGWLFNRPVADMLISHPALQRTYQLGGKLTFQFFEAYREELQRMQARYRVGDGDGVAEINSATNCSQDSASALYAVAERILELDSKVAVYPGEDQSSDFRCLVDMARGLRKIYLPWGKAPERWKDNRERRPAPL